MTRSAAIDQTPWLTSESDSRIMPHSSWHNYDHYGYAFMAIAGTFAAAACIQWALYRPRHAGWLAGSAALATYAGAGPDLVYLPEVPFNMEEFWQNMQSLPGF